MDFKHIIAFVLMQMCAYVQRTQERGNRLCVLHSLHGLPRQRC